MNKFVAFFRLVRLPNLLMIALTQYLLRWCVVIPILDYTGHKVILSNFDFFCVVLSTVLIAAAGYTINDYFDLKTDRINKPKKVIVGKIIKRRVAMAAHIAMNSVAILLAGWISYKVGMIKLVGIYAICTGLLWYYSVSFKRHILIGNLVIAILAAVVPITSYLFDFAMIRSTVPPVILERIFHVTLWYAGFAFITSIIREIIKDMEDIDGDKRAGCRTLPIAAGLAFSKTLVVILSTITFGLLVYVQMQFFEANWMYEVYYIALAVQLPLLFLTIKVLMAKAKKDYNLASKLTKVVMLSGMLSLLVIYLLYKLA